MKLERSKKVSSFEESAGLKGSMILETLPPVTMASTIFEFSLQLYH
jgi:hypothetical protein